jgi:carbon monoxide dehydrogenase subunit G
MNLSFTVKKSIDFTFDYLTDMEKFASVHPIISKIDSTGNESYLVHETLKIGFIPFSFTYPVTIEKYIIEKKVVIRATVFRLTKVNMEFELMSVNGYTLIKEEIRFYTCLPIKFILKKVFKEQHERLFRNIEAI